VPRAFGLGIVPDGADVALGGNSSNHRNAIKGSAYLVIRSATVALNSSVGKWSYVNYTGGPGNTNLSYIHKWNSAEDVVSNEAVITLVDTFSGTPVQRQLAVGSGGGFSYKLGAPDSNGNFIPPDDNYKPTGSIKVGVNNETVNVYALNNFNTASEMISMPFNRADYFIKRPYSNMPSACNPGTGILYKGVIINSTSSSGGGMSLPYPLLDCVGDMQVVFDIANTTASPPTTTPSNTLAGLTADDIRTRLKSVRVYLLTHEGHKDKNYTFSYTDPNNVIFVGDPRYTSLGRKFTASDMNDYFGTEWRNYRWRVITVVGQPYNLMY
jgi:hypothetical protein